MGESECASFWNSSEGAGRDVPEPVKCAKAGVRGVIGGGVEWIVDRDEAVDKRGGMSLSGCITCTAGGRLERRDDVADCKGGG